MANYGRPLMSRFDVDEETGCWNWNAADSGAVWGESYGIVGGDCWPERKAHRLFYRLYKGHIPKGFVVAHTCDNPRCVNPDHLDTKTQFENMREATERSRWGDRRGSKNACAKLNEDSAKMAKQMLMDGKTVASVARRLGVSETAIRFIKQGKTWKHVS